MVKWSYTNSRQIINGFWIYLVPWNDALYRSIRKKQMESEKVEYDMRDTIAKFFGPESRGIECVYIDALYDKN